MALGALLMAGNALGVTVHDVFSNGFWSAETRTTKEKLLSGDYKIKHNPKKPKRDRRGNFVYSGTDQYMPKESFPKWKITERYKTFANEDSRVENISGRLTALMNDCKEKAATIEQDVRSCPTNGGFFTKADLQSQTKYMSKPRTKEARPMGHFVVNDWFLDAIRECGKVDFYGTEQTAVTNIISDNEAYITRTIHQTTWINSFYGVKVNEGAALRRTYDTHITTDDDHVYVDQVIGEVSTNNPTYNTQSEYKTQYVATFKRGRWKGSTETITMTQNSQAADWYIKLWDSLSQNTR